MGKFAHLFDASSSKDARSLPPTTTTPLIGVRSTNKSGKIWKRTGDYYVQQKAKLRKVVLQYLMPENASSRSIDISSICIQLDHHRPTPQCPSSSSSSSSPDISRQEEEFQNEQQAMTWNASLKQNLMPDEYDNCLTEYTPRAIQYQELAYELVRTEADYVRDLGLTLEASSNFCASYNKKTYRGFLFSFFPGVWQRAHVLQWNTNSYPKCNRYSAKHSSATQRNSKGHGRKLWKRISTRRKHCREVPMLREFFLPFKCSLYIHSNLRYS